MLVSSIGFKNYVWFISLGYGFSIAAQGIAMLIMYGQGLSLGTIITCVLFILYGLRLGGYLAIREFGGSAYKKNMKGEIKDGKTVPFGVKIAIWTSCAVLYVTQVSGVFYRLANEASDNVMVFVGAGVMLLGVSLETAADIQKNNAKKVNPRRFVDTGLYRIVRCPNYLGEMIFWTGVLLSGIGAVRGWQWVVVAIGYIGIIFVMFSGARRLEVRQNKNYGNDPEYQKYVKTVPILLPFIPLYSVEKHKWLVA
jgi:steroid 5-alpha reductase family enzyme